MGKDNIWVTNLTQNKNFDSQIFTRILEITKKVVGIKDSFNIDVVLVGKNRIKTLNKFYRGINKVTTVLSFAEKEKRKSFLEFIDHPSVENLLGQVILCPSYIKKQSKRLKKNLNYLLSYYFVHGILHLLGYEHKDTKTTKEMKRKEKEILKQLITSDKRQERRDKREVIFTILYHNLCFTIF